MSYDPEYVYTHELNERDPRAEQPEKIKVPLKPHQLTSLHRALVMEKEDHFSLMNRTDSKKITVTTNIGIIGDIVGYGKTLVALSLIASNPVNTIRSQNVDMRFFQTTFSHFLSRSDVSDSRGMGMVMSTLLIVPHGPVFEQWKKALSEQTGLKFLDIGFKRDLDKHFPPATDTLSEIYRKLGEYDVVLIKTTMMRNMYDHFIPYTFTHRTEENPMHYWARVMIDEAHDSLERVPWMKYRYLWLISGTYTLIGNREYGSNFLGNSIHWVRNERNTILVRNNPAYVQQSFQVPQYTEVTHRCIEPYGLRRIRHILHADVARMIDAHDFVGAMRAMGIQEHNSSSIIEHITTNLERDLRNKRHEISYIESLEMDPAEKERKMEVVRKDIGRLEQKNESLREQFQKLESDQCSICYETFKDLEGAAPMVLPCNHVFCQPCIFRWHNVDNHQTCPCCRSAFTWNSLVSVVLPGSSAAANSFAGSSLSDRMTKEQRLLKILQDKPDGKFLIFSSFDHSFDGIMRSLVQAQITFAELKGTTSTMMKVLQNFKDGNTRCIMLNTYNTGSGIDISCATDVILFHGMGKIRHQAIGRAQRVGRSTPLTVHNLLHDQENVESA